MSLLRVAIFPFLCPTFRWIIWGYFAGCRSCPRHTDRFFSSFLDPYLQHTSPHHHLPLWARNATRIYGNNKTQQIEKGTREILGKNYWSFARISFFCKCLANAHSWACPFLLARKVNSKREQRNPIYLRLVAILAATAEEEKNFVPCFRAISCKARMAVKVYGAPFQ